MFDNLPDLINDCPIGSRIYPKEKREDYSQGKFIVEGYLYTKDGLWYPAHELANGDWEIYK